MIRLIDAKAVRALLPMDECVKLMRTAFRLAADPATLQPIRTATRMPDGRGLMSLMPGYIADPAWLGIKVVSVFPGNFGTQFGSHQGVVLLFDTKNGAPAALLDGREITAIRTAAATAVATDVLARKDARSFAVFGYGEQARTHLEALPLVRDFDRLTVWGRDFVKAQAFAAEMTTRLGREVRAVEDLIQAAQADVLCTATASAEPFFHGAWLRDGQHLNVVGSSIPTTSEIDHETLLRARLFVDYKPSALALGGDIRRAIEAGAMSEDHVLGSVGEVMTGALDGRTDTADITLFKSLGMVAEDLVSADHVLTKALAQGVGVEMEW